MADDPRIQSAIVDDGARSSATARASGIWSTSCGRRAHRRAAARSGRTSTSATTSSIGNNVKIQNNVSVYDAVDARGRRLLRAEHGVHQRLQPARGGRPQGRIPAARWSGAARRSAPTARSSAASRSASTPSSAPARSSTATCPPYALMVGVPARQIGWMSRCGERLRWLREARSPARTRAPYDYRRRHARLDRAELAGRDDRASGADRSSSI